MLLKWLFSKGGKNFQGSAVPQRTPVETDKNAQAPSIAVRKLYPPDDLGLPIWDVEALLAANQDLISRIKLHAAFDNKGFDARFLHPIRQLAGMINSLPGTPSSLFAGEGGMLRACLELAFLSFQASDGRIFTGAATVETRHKLEARWRYVCFMVGLLYPIGAPLARMAVSSSSGLVWQKHQYGLTEWANAEGVDRVYVNWPGELVAAGSDAMGPSGFTASIIGKVFGHEPLTWLDEGSPDLSRSVFEILGGGETQARIAKDVVLTMWGKVKQREEVRRPETYGRMTVGTHLHPYLVGAMKTLVETGVWTPNKAPLIVDASGVYLIWPEAGEDIVRQGVKEGRDGWPASASTLAELLKQSGIFDTSRANDMGMTEVVDLDGVVVSAYKMRNPNAILEDYDPAAFSKSAPKTVEGVLKQDPINKHARDPVSVPPVQDTGAQNQPEPDVAPEEAAVAETATAEDEDDMESDAPSEVVEPARVQRPAPRQASEAEQLSQRNEPPAKPAAGTEAVSAASVGEDVSRPTGAIKEAAEVKFSDLVPPDVRRDMKSVLSTEILGKLIKAWRERTERSDSMRMTDNGAAFAFEFLRGQMRSVPDWLNDAGAAGLIYTEPSKPGLKIQKVAIPEGSKPQDAVVLSSYAIKKLGL